MAISTSGTNASGSSTTTTVDITWTASGAANEILIVDVASRSPSGATPTITGVVWDPTGVNTAFTLVASIQNTTTRLVNGMFILQTPASGTKTARVTLSGTIEWANARARGFKADSAIAGEGTPTTSTAAGADNISQSHTLNHSGGILLSTASSNTGTLPTASLTQDSRVTAGADDFFGTQHDFSGTTGAKTVAWTSGDAGQGWTEVTETFYETGGATTTRGSPFDAGNAFNDGRTFAGPLRRIFLPPRKLVIAHKLPEAA